jgi:hypothetical protein
MNTGLSWRRRRRIRAETATGRDSTSTLRMVAAPASHSVSESEGSCLRSSLSRADSTPGSTIFHSEDLCGPDSLRPARPGGHAVGLIGNHLRCAGGSCRRSNPASCLRKGNRECAGLGLQRSKSGVRRVALRYQSISCPASPAS